jgi:hypothetical protein
MQLIGVFRKARVVDAWELASGRELSGIRLMNLDELPRLRKKFFQDQKTGDPYRSGITAVLRPRLGRNL